MLRDLKTHSHHRFWLLTLSAPCKKCKHAQSRPIGSNSKHVFCSMLGTNCPTPNDLCIPPQRIMGTLESSPTSCTPQIQLKGWFLQNAIKQTFQRKMFQSLHGFQKEFSSESCLNTFQMLMGLKGASLPKLSKSWQEVDKFSYSGNWPKRIKWLYPAIKNCLGGQLDEQ